jgi:23S rRNA (pseudouridine1915-N3)-methyltransferase
MGMKFSEINADSWPELQNYLDTCLIPVSGLTGAESPWETTDKVARTGQWLAPLEQAFRGRTVTMPAFHYDTGSLEDRERLNQLTRQWRTIGFRYIVAICGQPIELSWKLEVDLIIGPTNDDEVTDVEKIRKSVADLWRHPSKFQ